MMSDLKAQLASISSAICQLGRIVIVFSSTNNKMNEMKYCVEGGQIAGCQHILTGLLSLHCIGGDA